MYILVYDISDNKRLKRVSRICEKYLIRVQKSVFEGDLSRSQLFALLKDLKRVLIKSKDSVIIYFLRNASIKKKIQIGDRMEDPYLIF